MKKSKILPIILCCNMLFINISTLSVNAYEIKAPTKSEFVIKADISQIKYQDFGTELNDKLKNSIDDIEKLKLEKDVIKPSKEEVKGIYEVIDDFLTYQDNLTVEQYNSHFNDDQFDYIFYNLIYISYYNTKTTTERNDIYIYISDNMYKHIAKNHNNEIPYFYHTYYDYFLYLTENEFNEIDLPIRNAKNIITSIKPVQTPSGSKPSQLDENIVPSKIQITSPEKPVTDPNINNSGNNSSNPTVIPDKPPLKIEEDNKKVSYVEQEGVCYKLIEHLDSNNNPTYNDMTEVSKSEYKYCGIYDYEDIFNFQGMTEVDSSSLRDFSFSDDSNQTIFFTLNKKEDKPFYYNSGIALSSEGYLTYDKLYKLLNNISSKSNGYLVNDKDKFLAIISKKPIVINKNNEDKFEKDFILSLFNNFSDVGIIISDPETMSNKEDDTEINYNDVKQININGKKTNIKTLFKSDKVLFPMEDLLNNLNIKYFIGSNNVISITSGENKISIKDNDIYINDSPTDKSCYTQTIDNIRYIEIKNLIQYLEYNIDYNKSSGILSFDKKTE